jgi:hypothetical protein
MNTIAITCSGSVLVRPQMCWEWGVLGFAKGVRANFASALLPNRMIYAVV